MIEFMPRAFGGMQFIEDPLLFETIGIDWSGCRSIPRAMRRAKKYPQRTKPLTQPMRDIFRIGDKIIGHPETIKTLMAQLRNKIDAAQ